MGSLNLKIRKNTYALLILPGVTGLLVFVVFPIIWILRISFYENVEGGHMTSAWVVDSYVRFLGSAWYLKNVLWFSVEIAVLTTALAVILAYPLALYIVRSRGRWKQILLTLTLSPLLIGLVSLVYGWIVIFRGGGLLNGFTMWLGLTDHPVKYMYSIKGVVILLIYIGIPYVVLTLIDSLERIHPSLTEAAENAGANRWQSFSRIVFPLTVPGMYAGSLVVFVLNFSAFAVPLMVGSRETNMIGLVVYRQAMELNNMPFAAAISVVMMFASIVILFTYTRIVHRYFLQHLGR